MRPCFIRAVEYDAGKRELVVRMASGAGFKYSGVPEARGAAMTELAGAALIDAFDVGIEGKFKSERVT